VTQKMVMGQLSDIEIRRLRVFRVVAEAGGISAAELELNIGRSTISTHIKDLEIRLGVTLCRRGRGGFALTDEGRRIYQATLRLLGSLDEFRAEVDDLHQRMTGHMTIALFDKTVSNPEARIGKAFQLFDDLAPEMSLEVYVEPLNEIERGVMEGRFQAGLIPAHRTSPSLDYVPLFNEQMYLYCGHGHRLYKLADKDIKKTDILACKYAGLGYHSPNMEIGRSLGMKRDVTVYDQEAIAHLLLSGRYVGYLPDHYAKPFVEQGLIRSIGTDVFQYRCEFLAITRRSPKPSRAVRAFVDCLVKAHRDQAVSRALAAGT
jgi:DNA-binding transcriptional LysR family regulator